MPKQPFETELHNLGKFIKELRELFKLRQTSLAKLLNVSRSVIADIEQERHLPNVLTLLKPCDVFGITMAELCATTFPYREGIAINHERFLLHKAMHNSMDKTVTDNAISELRKE